MKKLLFCFILLLIAGSLQAKKDTISVRRVVLAEKKVKYIYTIRENGMESKREVIVMRQPMNPAKLDKDKISLLISKKNYRVYLLYNNQPLKGYKAVFGSGGYLDDKVQEGDKKTPEGKFKITHIKSHGEWYLFIGLNYPTIESRIKFEQNKKRLNLPSSARIGGHIGIHGTFDNQDGVIDQKFNWTDGCISMKNKDLAELVKYLQVGTPVVIIK